MQKEILKKNLYFTLNVDKHSNIFDIKQSYKKLAKEYHPDKNKDSDPDIFKNIIEAYEILIDDILRVEYDKKSKYGGNYNEIIELLDYEFDDSSKVWNEDKFNQFKKKEQLTIIIRVDETFDGTVEYERYVTCKSCKGSGKDLESKMHIKDINGKVIKILDSDSGCDMCEGTGKWYDDLDCGFCYGQGKIGSVDCKSCKGDKRILGKQKINNIKFDDSKKDHRVDFMGHFSKDNPGMVGHLWIVKNSPL